MAGKAHVKSANTLCKNKCIVPTLQILNSVYAACVNTFYDLKSHFSVECGIWYLIHGILRISNFYRSIDDIFVRVYAAHTHRYFEYFQGVVTVSI